MTFQVFESLPPNELGTRLNHRPCHLMTKIQFSMVKSIPILFVGILLSLGLHAQDIHFTQFMNTPLQVSPGLTGVFAGDTRLGGVYRSQWNQVPVPYSTFSVYADHKYRCGRDNPGFWSTGVALFYDRAGDSRLTTATFSAYGSYTQPLSKRSLITLGANLGLGQRRFDTGQLRSDSQFDPTTGAFNPGSGLGENFDRTSLTFVDFGLGANLRLQAERHTPMWNEEKEAKRHRLDLGVGVHHLNRPAMNFIDDQDVKLPMRLALYGDGLLQITDDIDLRLGVQAQFQQRYREYVGILGAKLHLQQDPNKKFALVPAIGIRVNEFTDAWFPMLEFHFRDNLRVSASYDINVSDFQLATDSQGAIEFNVRYLFKRVCPIPNVKYCPPFL